MGDPDRYVALNGDGEAETKVKGSRFLGIAWRAESTGEGEERLDALRKKYHDATHVCFAWKIGHGEETANRAADAGEPGGTAGTPIFGSIERAGITDCAVAVVRWFGGTKLGTGGLKRAYSDCARLALENAPTIIRVLRSPVLVAFAYSHTTVIQQCAARYEAVEGEAEYGEEVQITYLVPRSLAESFCADLVEIASGKIRITREE
jgi:uncharacterized YigZ family protein